VPAPVVRGDYDGLAQAAKVFNGEAQRAHASFSRLKREIEELRSGRWIGKGAKAFYQEMDSLVLPAFNQLEKAMAGGDQLLSRASKAIHDAEEETTRLFGQGAGGAAGDGAGAGASAGGGAGGTAGSAGLSPEGKLISDLLKALTTSRSAAKLFSSLKGGERILAIAGSTSLKAFSAGLTGIQQALSAVDRGVSNTAAGVDGAIGAVASWFGSPVGSAIGVIHNVTDAISPGAGKYTAILNDVRPTNVAKNLAQGTVDTVDALYRGDYSQLARHHDQNLNGQYGEVVRGYAIAADSIGAVVTGDSRRLNQLSDMAAGGKLGPLAKAGDWLGGKIYDWTH
jgi:WXG100 family type VII secretion target